MSAVNASTNVGYSPREIAESEIPAGVRLSADAKRLLYHVKPLCTPGGDTKSAIWVAEVDGGTNARQFTSGLHNDFAAQFHPDEKRIIFLSDRQKKGGPAQLFSIHLTGGEASLLTGKDSKSGVSSFEISPDGRHIAFTCRDEPSAEDERRLNDKDDPRLFGDKRSLAHLRLFTFATGSLRTLEQPYNKHIPHFTWASDSKAILFLTRKQAEPEFVDSEVELFSVSIDVEKGSLKLIGIYPHEPKNVMQVGENTIVDIQKHDPSILIDSQSVFVHSATSFLSTERLYGYTDDANSIINLRNGNKIAALIASRLDTKIEMFDVNKSEQPEDEGGITGENSQKIIFETKDEAIETAFDGNVWDLRVRDDGTLVLAVIKSSAIRREPLNVWAGTLRANDKNQIVLRQVSSHLQWMRDAPFCKTEAFHWKAKDGTDLDGILFYPPGEKGGSGLFPTILQMHGGYVTRFCAK